jgi:ACS family tartrate transporter-like MFS transporter
MGFSNLETGLIVAGTYLTAMLAILAVGSSSDRRGERLWHVVTCWLIAASAFIIASLSPTDIGVLVALTVAVSCVLAGIAPSFALPTAFLKGPASAGAMALMNVFASLGGFFAPILIGRLREQTGFFGPGIAMLAITLVMAAMIVLAFGRAIATHKVRVAGA